MAYTLSRRQRIFYTDRLVTFKPTYARDVKGRLTGTTYVQQETDVPCHFEINLFLQEPDVAGEVQSNNNFTRDKIHIPADLTIDNDWWVVNATLNGDGSQSKNYGKAWVIMGEPQSISQRGRRQGQKQIVQGLQNAKKPPGVTL